MSDPTVNAADRPQRRRGGVLVRLMVAELRLQTTSRILGWAWWLIDPLAMIAVYALVFGGVLGIGRVSVHGAYPLFLASALIPWRWFSLATTRGANAFTQNATLLTSFPMRRDAVLLGEMGAVSVQALGGLPVLALFMLVYDRPFTASLAYLPLPLLVMGLLAAGVAYLLCPLTVLLPDLNNAWGVILRIAWFLSPGLYSLEQLPPEYRGWYSALNPLVGVLEGIRRPIHDALPPRWDALGFSLLWAVAILALGRWVFRKTSGDSVRML